MPRLAPYCFVSPRLVTFREEFVMITDPELMTDLEVAAALRITPRRLADWRKRGTGPAGWFRAGKSILYRADALQTWLAAKTPEACDDQR